MHLPDGTVAAARCTWKDSKCPAIHKAIEASALAASPEWGRMSADHKVSLQAPKPAWRFSCTVTVQARVARSSGRKYYLADGMITPATASDWAKLGHYYENIDKDGALRQAVADSMERRTQEVIQKRCK